MLDGSPESLSFLFQLVGLMAAAVFTFLCRRKRWAIAVGPAVGFVVDIVAQGIMMGGGPSMCIGFVVYPLYGLVISWLTLKLARSR